MRLLCHVLFLNLCIANMAVGQATATKEKSDELKVLDRFLGTWEVKLTTKAVGQEAFTTKNLSHRKWSSGGSYLVFEDLADQELTLTMTYDPESRTYPGTIMIGTRRGLVSAKWNEDKSTMNFEIDYPDGIKYRGAHRFVDKNSAIVNGRVLAADGSLLVELKFDQSRKKMDNKKN